MKLRTLKRSTLARLVMTPKLSFRVTAGWTRAGVFRWLRKMRPDARIVWPSFGGQP